MTSEERERLAALVASELQRNAESIARTSGAPGRTSWLPEPIRPATSTRGGQAPDWSAAAQSLGDLAPIRAPTASSHRVDAGEHAAAVRAAAAGARSDSSRSSDGARGGGSERRPSRRYGARRGVGGIEVSVGVSRRHVHLSSRDAQALFGSSTLDVNRDISQPGQFAAKQRVTAIVGARSLEAIRVVGPTRGDTQLEMTIGDALRLGIAPPVAASGALGSSLGGVTLVGTHGRITLERGVIVAARHLHVAPADAERWGIRDGDRVDIRCGDGPRAVTWHGVLVRSGATHATELHLDEDEANAAGISTGARAVILSHRAMSPGRRPLVTERDIESFARTRDAIPEDALVTPAARDRARSLGVRLP